MIKTVKIKGDLYLLNGTMFVPMSEENRHYKMIQEWISDGNTPEPELSESELSEKDEAERLAGIDAETKSRIIELFDGATSKNYLEKQMNAMMRAVQINAIAKSSQSSEQKKEAAKLVEIADSVESIRLIGNKAETYGTALVDIDWS
jgi:predicted site-specific integrase-resolvase